MTGWGCFAYSAEEGTPAAEYPDQVPEDIRIKRQENIMELQARMMEENCIQSEGREISVMVEGYDRLCGQLFRPLGRGCTGGRFYRIFYSKNTFAERRRVWLRFALRITWTVIFLAK